MGLGWGEGGGCVPIKCLVGSCIGCIPNVTPLPCLELVKKYGGWWLVGGGWVGGWWNGGWVVERWVMVCKKKLAFILAQAIEADIDNQCHCL